MTAHTKTIGPASEHEELLKLLPWYLNDSLSKGERLRVQGHLDLCLICRRELKFQRSLARSVRENDADVEAVSYNFSKLQQRIAASENRHRVTPHSWTELSRLLRAVWRSRRFYYAAALAAVIAVAVGFNLPDLREAQGTRPFTADYQTLSSSATGTSLVRSELFIAFQKDVPDSLVLELLRDYGLEPVTRSEQQSLWRVRVAGATPNEEILSSVITGLRSRESILFVDRALPSD
ncbi:MAG: zf-HC2 domain-containing protein [Gammaproteobacteria bacterium]|nr:zf-HC2 domain-containing protein [Planctomycetaceae bacterium]MCB1672095.1 zf-HC2 domain-containing protein [Pseudomonadales bacterium]MCP5347964.1 zf-HC2 domain-containing protein [Pseudomonadales bacterium]